MFESLEELAALVGPFGAFVVIPIWFGATGRLPWRHLPGRQRLLGLSVSALSASYWVTWWFAFDWVEGEAVPNALFPLTTWLMYATAAGCTALVARVAAMFVMPRLALDRPT